MDYWERVRKGLSSCRCALLPDYCKNCIHPKDLKLLPKGFVPNYSPNPRVGQRLQAHKKETTNCVACAVSPSSFYHIISTMSKNFKSLCDSHKRKYDALRRLI